MTCKGRWNEHACTTWQRWEIVLRFHLGAGVDYTDDFYDDIYQDPDYEDIEQQDIDLEADDKISKGEMESLEAGTKNGSGGQSEGQTSIQDETEPNEIEAEEADNFIEEYVLNDQAYTLNHQSSVVNEESV